VTCRCSSAIAFLDAQGQLVYPVSGNPAAPWVPEVYGDAMLVNGRLFPFVEVDPAPYRLRLINACNGRYLHLSIAEGVPFHQIAGDQGLLDDRCVPRGLTFCRGAGRSRPRFLVVRRTPDSRSRMTGGRSSSGGRPRKPTPFGVPAALRPVTRLMPSEATAARTHTLAEETNLFKQPMRMLINDLRWHAPVTETPRLGSTEIWSLVNVTDDAHPIHLHLVRFQIVDRRPFDVFAYQNTGELRFVGPPMPPDPASRPGRTGAGRARNGDASDRAVRGFAGRYMWHCHLVEHGDNEMMRPLEILPEAIRL